jgi:hypothetical protein
MARRWPIRALFMLPILLCLAGWAWSWLYAGQISYTRHGSVILCGTHYGSIFSGWGRSSVGSGWTCIVIPESSVWHLERPDPLLCDANSFGIRGLGMAGPSGTMSLRLLYVPTFLLSVFSTFPLIISLRKRRKINPKMAFPVELASPPK